MAHRNHKLAWRGSRGARVWVALFVAMSVLIVSCSSADDPDPDEASPDTDEGSADEEVDSEGDGDQADPSDGSSDESEGGARGGVLRLAQQLPIETLDPDRNVVAGFTLVTNQIYDQLTTVGDDGAAKPMLAESWTAGSDGDGPYLDFNLRPDLEFPDGASFGAETVIANIERSRTLEGSTTAADVAGLTVEEISPLIVRFRQGEGVAALPLVLSGIVGSMISQDAIADGVDLATEAVGIAPFHVEAFNPERLVLTANDDYWDPDAVRLDGVEILSMGTDARVNAARAGDVHVTHVPAELADSFEGDYEVTTGQGQLTVASYKLNTGQPPLDDVRVRRAMSMALDREGLCQAAFGGACDPAYQLFSVNSPFYDPDASMEYVTYDPDAARALLEEADAVGASVAISTFDFPGWSAMAEIAQAAWEEVGLSVDVVSAAVSESSRAFREGDIPIRTSGVGPYTDPIDIVNLALLPGSPDNVGGLVIDEMSALAEEGMATLDADERREVFQRISAITAQELPHIPGLSINLLWITNPEVSGFNSPGVLGRLDLRGVSLDAG